VVGEGLAAAGTLELCHQGLPKCQRGIPTLGERRLTRREERFKKKKNEFRCKEASVRVVENEEKNGGLRRGSQRDIRNRPEENAGERGGGRPQEGRGHLKGWLDAGYIAPCLG